MRVSMDTPNAFSTRNAISGEKMSALVEECRKRRPRHPQHFRGARHGKSQRNLGSLRPELDEVGASGARGRLEPHFECALEKRGIVRIERFQPVLLSDHESL